MATQKVQPDPGALERQHHDQRRRVAKKKTAVYALVAAIVVAGVVIGINALPSDESRPGSTGSTPTLAPEPEQTLSIVDVGSGTETPFAAPVGASLFTFALDGSMVAYSDLDENGNVQVFVMDADGSNARQLTHGEGGVGGYGLPWSPDGSMIAYARDTSGKPPQIFVVRVSNGESTMVTQEPEGAVDPGGWAPDGGSIIFSTFNPPISHYSALSLDLTTGRTRMIVADGSTPTLSPDGALIAFNSWLKPDPLVRLILANSDGSERRVIARLNGDDGYQRWSPDSTQIAFVDTTADGSSGTYVYDLATGETRFVTAGRIESWVDDDHILVS